MENYPKLTAAQPLDDYRLLLTFDGQEGRTYDFSPHLNHKFYKPLQERGLFRRVYVEDGELQWPTGQDF
jgi:hypothetical protein